MATFRFNIFLLAMVLFSQNLDIQCLHLDCRHPDHVYNCSKLSLDHISLDEQIPDDVETLDLSYNNIRVVPEVPKMASLKHLNLSHNSIVNITDDAFYNIGDTLKDLDLSFNNIHGENLNDKTFQGLNIVDSIILSHNPLGGLPESSFKFNYLNGLNQLDLSHCEIELISINAFTDIKNMNFLNLSNNKLQHFSHDIFKGLHTLVILDLSNNKINSLNVSQFIHLDSVETIFLDNNFISSINEETFRDLIELKYIYLRNNRLQQFPFLAVIDVMSLAVLDFSNNPMTTIDRPTLPKDATISIETLRVEYMHDLETIRGHAFSDFTELKEIYITHNHRLFIINETAFDIDDSALKKVYLNDNSLVTLSETLLPWDDIEEISVANNVWNCDCHLSWVLNETSNFTSEMRCSSPESVRGKYLKDLLPQDLKCSNSSPTSTIGRPYVAIFLTVLLVAMIILATIVTALYFILKKKINCKPKPRGKYVMVYTQEADEAYIQEEPTPTDKTPLNNSVDV